MARNETVDLMNMITIKLNSFFSQISDKNYEFENTTSLRKNQQDRKQKLLRKAFKIYKKKQITQIANNLTQKEKDKLIIKSWEKLSEDEKIKYAEPGKVIQKKMSKKKKQNEAFRPGANE